MKSINLIVVILLGLLSLSNTISSSIDISSRYDNINRGRDQERIQDRIRIRSDAEISKKLHLIGLFATGNQYISQWNTTHNIKDNKKTDHNFNVRQAYAEYKMDEKTFYQMGIIPPIIEQSHTNISHNGWLEGVRLVQKSDRFSGALVAASLDDVDNPSPASRTRSLNFGRAIGEYDLGNKNSLALGGSQLENNRYLHLRFLSTTFENQSICPVINLEIMNNVDSVSYNYSLSISSKPLALFHEELKDYLKFEIAYFRIDNDIGQFGTLSDDFYAFGLTKFFGASGKILKDGSLLWTSEYWDNDIPRFKLGLVYKYAWENEF